MATVKTTAKTPSSSGPKARRAAAPKRPTSARKPAAGTARNSTSAGTPSHFVTGYAERAVLIPIGAALAARDLVLSSVNDTISSYSSTSKAQAQLRKFERRGNTARNRLEREVRKARVRVERELRQRRRDSAELAERVQERILSLV
jgi:hypothetical protein